MEKRIVKIIQEEIESLAKEGFFDSDFGDDYVDYDGGDFDRTEFDGPAKNTAKTDIEGSGEEFVDLGDSEHEKNMDPEDFKSDLERANLRLPSDEKEVAKIQKDLDAKKKARSSMRGFSLNEEK